MSSHKFVTYAKSGKTHTPSLSKSFVKKSKRLKISRKNSNFPRHKREISGKNMLDEKVDQLEFTSVNINMADVVDEVIMDSDENEDIIPKSTEE